MAANEYAISQGLLGDVFFDYDAYELRQDARDRLAQNAKFLTSHPQFILTIEGHADERGTNDYNLALGEKRANAAKEYLSTLGVGSERLRTVSYGEERAVLRREQRELLAAEPPRPLHHHRPYERRLS